MQQHQWLIEVLNDISEYAERNDLPQIAEAIPVLRMLAEQEIRKQEQSSEQMFSLNISPIRVFQSRHNGRT